MSQILEDIKKAIRYNLKQRGKLWEQQEIPWGFLDAGSKGFAIHTAAFQGDVGLKIDGMLGPNTLRKICTGAEPVEKEQLFLLGGETIEVSEELKGFGTFMGIPFESRKKTTPPEHIVIHESVTRSVDKTVSVLEKKGLGVHFMIDWNGNIHQHCDPLTE